MLDHSPSAVDLSFMDTGRAPLLVDHDHTRQIGVFERAELEGRTGVGAGRFSRAQRAADDVRDVQDGIRQSVSVGYMIHEVRVEAQASGLPILRVTKWQPYEVSVLSVPADMLEATIEARSLPMEPNSEETPNTETRQQPPVVQTNQPQGEDPAVFIENEKVRRREIRALAARHNQSQLGDQAIQRGWELPVFKGALLDIIQDGTPLETVPTDIGMSPKEVRSFSFLRLLQYASQTKPSKKMADLAGLELEAVAAAADALKKERGREPTGMCIPHDVMMSNQEGYRQVLLRNATGLGQTRGVGPMQRVLTVGGADTGDQLVGTDHLGGSFIEVLYNSMQVRQLGATVLSGLRGNVDIPRRTAGGSVRWTAEQSTAVTGANLAIGDSTFDQVQLTPREVTTSTGYTRRLIQQSDPSIEALVRSDLAMQIALAVDSVAINGDNTADANQPDGILNATGVTDVSFGASAGGAITYALAVQMIGNVLRANSIGIGNPAWLVNANGWERSMTVSRDSGSGRFLMENNQIVGYPWALSEQVPSNLVEGGSGPVLNAIIFAAWSGMLMGEWGVLELLVDPYTITATGAVQVSAFFTTDIAFRYPQAFVKSSDMT